MAGVTSGDYQPHSLAAKSIRVVIMVKWIPGRRDKEPRPHRWHESGPPAPQIVLPWLEEGSLVRPPSESTAMRVQWVADQAARRQAQDRATAQLEAEARDAERRRAVSREHPIDYWSDDGPSPGMR